MADDVETCPPSDGIWAKINTNIEICSSPQKYDRVKAIITITATNTTNTRVHLAEPYHLPARNVFVVTATTGSGEELRATASNNEICVRFDDRDRNIEPGEVFEWTVEYIRMSEVYFDSILAYDLYIQPQMLFQHVPVRKQQFAISLTLFTPEDERWWWLWLKRWRIQQRNSLKLSPAASSTNRAATYNFDTFDVLDEPFNLKVSAVYAFRSWIAHAFQLTVGAVTVVVIEHGLSWSEQLARWLKDWWYPGTLLWFLGRA